MDAVSAKTAATLAMTDFSDRNCRVQLGTRSDILRHESPRVARVSTFTVQKRKTKVDLFPAKTVFQFLNPMEKKEPGMSLLFSVGLDIAAINFEVRTHADFTLNKPKSLITKPDMSLLARRRKYPIALSHLAAFVMRDPRVRTLAHCAKVSC